MVPYLDLKAQYRSIKPEIDSAIANIVETNQFILGKEVAGFEQEFAAYCQTQYAIGVNSGTSALHLALLAAGIKPGDEVITVPFTFVATVAAILYANAKPVLVDIDPETYCLDVTRLEPLITPKTKAVIPVHLYGHPCDMDPLMQIAKKHGLIVIEDACQAHGAEYKNRRVGSIGDIGCFSHYPVKNLGAFGEGGTVTTNNPEYNKKIRMLRDWGSEKKYAHELKGYNYRMEGIQGAVLRVKLRHLEQWTLSRIAFAERYHEMLQGSEVVLPVTKDWARHVFHAYTIRTHHRDRLLQDLQKQEIQTGIHYAVPVHLQKAYSDMGYAVGSFPVSEAFASQVLSLPVFPEMTAEQQQTVARAVRQALQ